MWSSYRASVVTSVKNSFTKSRRLFSTSDVDVISICKGRGFIQRNSLIYGGLKGSYDYGPLGVQLKRNIVDLWYHDFIKRHPECYSIGNLIILLFHFVS